MNDCIVLEFLIALLLCLLLVWLNCSSNGTDVRSIRSSLIPNTDITLTYELLELKEVLLRLKLNERLINEIAFRFLFLFCICFAPNLTFCWSLLGCELEIDSWLLRLRTYVLQLWYELPESRESVVNLRKCSLSHNLRPWLLLMFSALLLLQLATPNPLSLAIYMALVCGNIWRYMARHNIYIPYIPFIRYMAKLFAEQQ